MRRKLGGANGLSFVLPLAAVITNENLDDGLAMCEGKPDAYLLDDIMTEEEVQQFFVQEGAAEALHDRHFEPVHQQRIPHADDRRVD